jgi:hypothetical protein
MLLLLLFTVLVIHGQPAVTLKAFRNEAAELQALFCR